MVQLRSQRHFSVDREETEKSFGKYDFEDPFYHK